MVAVIFEVWPNEGKSDEYFKIAGNLRSDLEKIEGFISIERFESLTTKGKFLSLSFWKDMEAVAKWRNQKNHRDAQHKGRSEVFSNYRLRVASVVRDYGLNERDEAPKDSF